MTTLTPTRPATPAPVLLTPADIAARSASQPAVEDSMSVSRKVTVPVGSEVLDFGG